MFFYFLFFILPLISSFSVSIVNPQMIPLIPTPITYLVLSFSATFSSSVTNSSNESKDNLEGTDFFLLTLYIKQLFYIVSIDKKYLLIVYHIQPWYICINSTKQYKSLYNLIFWIFNYNSLAKLKILYKNIKY